MNGFDRNPFMSSAVALLLLADLSRRQAVLNPRPVHVGFIMGKSGTGTRFSPSYLVFLVSVQSRHHRHHTKLAIHSIVKRHTRKTTETIWDNYIVEK